MNRQTKISIFVIGSLWSTVGGILCIMGSIGLLRSVTEPYMFGMLVVSMLVGILKGYFVLGRRVGIRIIESVISLPETPENLYLGWAKAIGIRGGIIISVMVVLGVLLGILLDSYNHSYRCLLRLCIGCALLTGGIVVWRSLLPPRHESTQP